MEKPHSQWNAYYEKTKEGTARPSLIKAVELVQERDIALDLGAGALRESRYLLEAGFKKVIAIDSEVSVQDRSKDINDPRLEIVISRFEEFQFCQDSFDLVNAQYSLPFVLPKSFDTVFHNIKNSLKKGGIFTGQLFGKNDGWKNMQTMTFHTTKEIQQLLSDMDILNFQEVERDGHTAMGDPKHWHVFEITAQKKF